ncbi:LPS assembly outer membrane protein LptD (organic solvent tolerance protein OstA) [Ekhidna lutea]|uniref:LPS assembly outer membrane protein LptD (Organic solvent tolerance protein OstA) n=1 Tax=Ekhidna lutea TaxID=447679 RepID=A0A239KBX1_EKHLU|nr:putative LPS assembly protein LptD [Ekhidna lutea]SNT15109.1 LPS assembly outer membrane protein LptD (organic solvent tolerance protein OstA) [Ekhidna lutea]
MRWFILLFCSLFFLEAFAQEVDSLEYESNEVIIAPDTARINGEIKTDSTAGNSRVSRRSDIETTINYHAKDSLFFDVNSRELFLYGETHIDYGNIALDAERTDVNWDKRTLQARYITDSTGKKIGKPVFTEGPDTYVTDDILYNFKSERALIKGVVTEQQGGFMHGEDVKKNAEDELFIRGAEYTTCNLEDPHFSIKSSKLKVIPNNKVVSGPFNMRFRDVPTPLFFPFGMFPQPKEKSSGIIVPSYGEERRRGFFLRGGGYYFAISDYIDLRLTGDIYSKGGNGINAVSNYYKRYSFRGTFNLSHNKSVSDDLENPLETNDYWVRWNHTPESRGNSSISASVSAGTSSYNDNNNLVNQDFTRSINSQFTSNISYRKTFAGTPFNMSSNLRHSQNIQTGIVNLTLPDLTVNMNRIYPFKQVVKSSNSPLAKLNFSHNFVAKNELSNDKVRDPFQFDVANKDTKSDSVIAFNQGNLGEIFRRSQMGGKHTIPISTSMSVLKYFTINPTFNYTDFWYTKELQYEYLPDENAVRVDTVDGFSRAGSWSTGASLNTRIYGTAFFSKGKIQAIRHVMTPSVSFNYSPDFSDSKYGVYSDVQVDSDSTFQRVSKYQGFAYGSPSGGESKTIGFSLSNNIEMKVASKKDTVNGFKKVKLFDNLGLSSGYNIAADSFKLSNINFNARTSFFDGKISVNVTGSLDPYEYLLISETTNSQGNRIVNQRRLNRFTWNNGNGVGRLSNLNTSLSFNLSPRGSRKNNTNNDQNSLNGLGSDQGTIPPDDQVGFDGYSDHERQQVEHIQNNPEMYVDFAVPWTLRMQYSINRTQRGFQDASIRQSFQFSGTLGLTDKTQLTFNSGYDFEAKDFTTTRLGISRDLHCWTMNFDWVPFGRFQSYFLSIRVKSAVLQDLKLEKRRSFFDFFN